MDVDAKDIQILLSRILNFSMNICCRFLQNHPFVSSALLFLFVVYLFLPNIFLFLLYSSPFLGCTAVFIRFYFHSQCSKIQNDVKDHAISSAKSQPRSADLVLSRDYKPSTQSQTVSHKNVKEKCQGLESPAVLEEKNMFSSIIPKAASSSRAVLKEGKPRETTEKDDGKSISSNVPIDEKIGSFNEASKPNLSSLDVLAVKASKCDGGGEAEVENSSSEEDEEEKKRDSNKAVEWTEDDQKNLMDLGISELEKNNRLESLIARRKERKLFKMRTDKFLIALKRRSPIPVAPLFVARGNSFDVSNNPDEQVPGSAPSVLLPTRNPFDLPYDPFEEKPDLTADSFQQEFMPVHQKDMLYCRHESFTLGPSSPLEDDYDDYDIAGIASLRRQRDEGNHDWLVDHLLSQKGETLRRTVSVTDLVTEEEEAEEGDSSDQVRNQPEEDGESFHSNMEIKETRIENSHDSDSSLGLGSITNMRTDTINHNKNDLSSENVKTIIKPNKLEIQPPVFRFPEVMNSPTPNSTPCPIPKAKTPNELSYAVSPSTIDRSRLENHLLYTHNVPWHTPTHSVASDMQVEFSEIGSPPLTGDGSASSSDGDSLTFDEDIEKEITCGSEEMWGLSPLASKVREPEMTGGFSAFHKESEDPITSSSRIELPQEGHNNSINSAHKIFNDLEQIVEAAEKRPSDAVSPEESMAGTYSLHEGFLQNPQASTSPPEKSAEELNIRYDVDVPGHAFDHLEGPKSVEDRNAEAEKFITSKVCDISKVDEEINSETRKGSERNSINTPEQSGEKVNVACSMDDPIVHMNSGANGKSIKQEFGNQSETDKECNKESSQNIESKPSNSPAMPAEEVNIPYNVDDPLVDLDVTEVHLKSSENRDRIEKYIAQEVLVELTKRADENKSEIGMYTENTSDKPPDNRPIIESLMPTTEDNKYNEVKHESMPCGDGEERSNMEVEVSGVNQSWNDPSTSGTQQEMTVEQASTVSSLSSSPKSVLPDRTSLDQTPSGLNQHIHTDVSESSMEEMIVRIKLLNEQVTETVELSASQNTHHVTDHPSIASKSEKSEEESNFLKKSTNEAREMYNINKAVDSDEEAKEDLKSTKTIQGELETSISNEDAKELSKPPPEIVPEFTVKEEGLKNPPGEFKEDASANSGSKDAQGESKDLTEHRTSANPSQPDVESDHLDSPVTVRGEEALLQKSTSINDAAVDDMARKEKLELPAGESQRLDEKADATEPSEAMKDSSSGYINPKAESGNMTDNAVYISHSHAAGEGNSSNEERNIEDVATREGSDKMVNRMI